MSIRPPVKTVTDSTQFKRTLKVRLAERRRAVQKSDVSNGIVMHVANTSHNIDWANAKVVRMEAG